MGAEVATESFFLNDKRDVEKCQQVSVFDGGKWLFSRCGCLIPE
jgi:hypothetical protein